MTESETKELNDAIGRLAGMPEFQVFVRYLENRVAMLTLKLLSSDSDVTIDNMEVVKMPKKTDVTILSVSTGRIKHEANVYRAILLKIEDCLRAPEKP